MARTLAGVKRPPVADAGNSGTTVSRAAEIGAKPTNASPNDKFYRRVLIFSESVRARHLCTIGWGALKYRQRSLISQLQLCRKMERAAGIEPASSAWKAEVLPLHNARATRAVVFHHREGVKAAKRPVDQTSRGIVGTVQQGKRKLPRPGYGTRLSRTRTPVAGHA